MSEVRKLKLGYNDTVGVVDLHSLRSSRWRRLLIWLGWPWILLALALLSVVCLGATKVSQQTAAIVAYHTKVPGSKYSVDAAWIEGIVQATDQAATLLGVGQYTNIMLTQWDIESDFTLKARTGVCEGIPQLNHRDLPYYYKELDKVMPGLPALKDVMKYPQTQVALGVMAFKCKLRDAHGDVWEAVRRYNGRGLAARRYKEKVRKLYLRIFKDIRHNGEAAAPRIGAKKEKHMRKIHKLLGAAMLVATLHQHVVATEVPDAEQVSTTAVDSAAVTTIFRDHDFSQGGYGPAVEAQKAAYIAARNKYKSTWALADVKEAARLAFTSPVAAWVWYNYANHQTESDSGDLGEAEKALDKVEELLKGFTGKDVDAITALIAHRRKDIEEQSKQ